MQSNDPAVSFVAIIRMSDFPAVHNSTFNAGHPFNVGGPIYCSHAVRTGGPNNSDRGGDYIRSICRCISLVVLTYTRPVFWCLKIRLIFS
jgi:hypothetical protein